VARPLSSGVLAPSPGHPSTTINGELASLDVIDHGTVLKAVPDTWDASLCQATHVSISHFAVHDALIMRNDVMSKDRSIGCPTTSGLYIIPRNNAPFQMALCVWLSFFEGSSFSPMYRLLEMQAILY
jgi:hypothetical protein